MVVVENVNVRVGLAPQLAVHVCSLPRRFVSEVVEDSELHAHFTPNLRSLPSASTYAALLPGSHERPPADSRQLLTTAHNHCREHTYPPSSRGRMGLMSLM